VMKKDIKMCEPVIEVAFLSIIFLSEIYILIFDILNTHNRSCLSDRDEESMKLPPFV